ncbi:MAG: DUF192 domain-containing protein [Actinomycetota bacterium]|nr:DUF192 domain-containing protein [Actinomycetota bacterium]
MGWLLREGEVLGSVEVANGTWARARGLLGRDGVDGAVLLTRTRAVHSIGMRFAIDVAYLDKEMAVVRTARLRPNRIGRPCLRARSVVEAESGSFGRWNLRPGDRLEVRS